MNDIARTYTHINSTQEFRRVCFAKLNRSQLPVVVLENSSSSEFIVVPVSEFELDYEPKPQPKPRRWNP